MNTENDIKIELAAGELKEMALSVRKKVFIKEQKIPKNLEFNKNDDYAVHILAYIQKRHRKLPIGTMRIRLFADFAIFERMAVIHNFRKTNVAQKIMEYGFNYVSIKGYKKVRGMCKQELLNHWEQCGYKKIKDAKAIQHNGMTLIPIERQLPPNPQALNMASEASLLAAQEGHWFDKNETSQQPLSKIDSIFLHLKKFRDQHLKI